MNAGPRRRFGLVTLLLLGAALALGSLWLLEVTRQSGNDAAPTGVRTDPDYYVENFNFVRMGNTGEAQYNISGARMVHNPVDNSHLIDKPVINSLARERPPMHAYADKARVEQDSDKVHMYDNVVLDRPQSPKADYFHLESDYLLVLTDEEIMKTDRPVRMTLGNSKLDGTGMSVNNATGELHLFNQVHATLPPRTATR
jgi:lipopolysaccharide export system protein LptC